MRKQVEPTSGAHRPWPQAAALDEDEEPFAREPREHRSAEAAPPRTARGGRAKTATAAAPVAVPVPVPVAPPPIVEMPPPMRRQTNSSNPFGADGEAEDELAAAKRAAKTASEPASAKSEPTAARPAKREEGLDDLMAGGAGAPESKPKSKRSASADIDNMLKDVPKSGPAAPPKRTEPAALPSLTANDIAKAMAGVKTGANACGRRFGQAGTAELRLTIGKDGKVASVAVRGKLANSPIAECVEAAARAASFPPNSGLKFDYRIDIH